MKSPADLPKSLKDAPRSVSWSGENTFRLQPSTDLPGHAERDQRQDPGAGEPQFAIIHVTRQRRGMIDPAETDRVLKAGAERAREIAEPVVAETKKLVGLLQL